MSGWMMEHEKGKWRKGIEFHPSAALQVTMTFLG